MTNKNLITLAAMLAASGAAVAQSSVTLYGTADVGVGKFKGEKMRMQTNNALTTSDSYLGLKGVEDLGGGLKAGFRFEQGLSLRDGSADTQRAALPTKTMFQRAAHIWLGGNWGTVQLGRAYTPSRNAMAAWDLTGVGNNSINVLSFGAVGGETDERNSSQLAYKTPNFGGFAAEIGYIFKPDNGGNSKIDLGLTYANGPLSVGLAYNKTKNLKANYALGAQYQFGMFALAAGYYHSRNGFYNDDTTGERIPGSVARANGFSLGGKVNFGAASVVLDVARQTKAEYDVGGVNYKGKKYTNALLEGRYALSKRTFFYGNYIRYYGTNNYGVGMRHDF
ncbi:MAG: porin [Ottowia sp.]|uniref:porin n=1 Tax=Ottowia sp. TaxID=1898956 RepID=UPI0039E223FE